MAASKAWVESRADRIFSGLCALGTTRFTRVSLPMTFTLVSFSNQKASAFLILYFL